MVYMMRDSLTQELYVIDSINDVLAIARIRGDHMSLLMMRGWIDEKPWLDEDNGPVYTITHERFAAYLSHAAV